MHAIWLLNANRCYARIFSFTEPYAMDGAREIDALCCPQARRVEQVLKNSLASGRSARQHVARAAAEREARARQFAGEIAERLEQGRLASQFDELILVSPPDFLTLLRAALSRPCAARITQECHKDMLRCDWDEIILCLPVPLQPPFEAMRQDLVVQSLR